MLSNLKVSFFLALRSLQRGNRGSIFLTILIIAMVFTNMIFLPSIVTGAVKNAERSIIDYSTSSIVIEPKQDDEYIFDLSDLLEKLNKVPGVERAAPHFSMGSMLQFKSKRLGSSVTAIRPNDERQVTKVWTRMKEGDYLGEGETGQVIIGNYVAGHKDTSEDFMPSLGGVRVGYSITIDYTNGVSRTYRVKGIVETQSYDADLSVYTTWDDMESVIGKPIDYANAVLVKTAPGLKESDVKNQIYKQGVQEQVKTWQDLISKAMGKAVQGYSIINGVTVIVSLVIAVVVLFIVIMIKTLNSRRQIGILKAVGIERSIIINNYLFQVIILTIIGTICGVILVEALISLMNIYPLHFPEGDIVPYVTPLELLTNSLYLFIVSAIAGYIPAWRVASEDILTAMRS